LVSDQPVVDPGQWYASLPLPSLAGEIDGHQAVMVRSYAGTSALMEKPALSDNLVCVHQGGAKRVHRWQAGTHRYWDVPPDAISLMPRLHANRWWTEGPIAFTHLTLSSGLLARMAREEFDRDTNGLMLVDRVGVADNLGAQLITALADDMRSARPVRLYRESLLTALIVRVLLEYSTMSRPVATERARGGLPGWQLRRIIDFMAAHLADDVGAAELVGLVGLSRAQFFRAFRQSTGQTPGRYLLTLRMERARHLLAAPTGTVEDVARAVGFSDVDSFTRAFRRCAGVSPAAWRRRHRGSGLGRDPD
jgi:AraC family transcriptional regulator